MPGEKGEHPSARALGCSEEVTFRQRPGGYEELATGKLGQRVQQRQKAMRWEPMWGEDLLLPVSPGRESC